MTVDRLYLQAELAFAAYARNLSSGTTSSGLALALGPEAGGACMSASQAERFVGLGWTVVAQESHSTGMSATVFQDASGARFLAVRGTEPSVSDLLADGILATVWIALLNPQYLALYSTVQSWIASDVLPESFTVCGHSLGGYLAAALKTQVSQVSEAFLFNSPGDWGVAGTSVGLVQSAFPTGEPGSGGIWNVKGSEGLSLISGLGALQSTVVPVQLVDLNLQCGLTNLQ